MGFKDMTYYKISFRMFQKNCRHLYLPDIAKSNMTCINPEIISEKKLCEKCKENICPVLKKLEKVE
jgi:hypothetical protein